MLSTLTKALSATLMVFTVPTPVLAQVHVEKYTAYCEVFGKPSTCTVVDTRNADGFLNTRGVYNNTYGYTMKQRFVEGRGFMTYDSYNGKMYKFTYEVVNGMSRVTPDLVIEGVSWD